MGHLANIDLATLSCMEAEKLPLTRRVMCFVRSGGITVGAMWMTWGMWFASGHEG